MYICACAAAKDIRSYSINSNCSEFAIAHYYPTSEGVLIATIALMQSCTMLVLCLFNFIVKPRVSALRHGSVAVSFTTVQILH